MPGSYCSFYMLMCHKIISNKVWVSAAPAAATLPLSLPRTIFNSIHINLRHHIQYKHAHWVPIRMFSIFAHVSSFPAPGDREQLRRWKKARRAPAELKQLSLKDPRRRIHHGGEGSKGLHIQAEPCSTPRRSAIMTSNHISLEDHRRRTDLSGRQSA